MDQPKFTKIDVQDSQRPFMKDGERRTLPRVQLPDACMEWLIAGRRALYDLLDGKGNALLASGGGAQTAGSRAHLE